MAVQVSEAQTFAGALGAQNNVHIWNAGVDILDLSICLAGPIHPANLAD